MAITLRQLDPVDTVSEDAVYIMVGDVSSSSTAGTIRAALTIPWRHVLKRVVVANRDVTGSPKVDVYGSTATILSAQITAATDATVDTGTISSSYTQTVYNRDRLYTVRVVTSSSTAIQECWVGLVFRKVFDKPVGA